MGDVTPLRDAGVGRLGRAAAWISALCALPYLALKVLWTFDVPVGITDRTVLDSSGWVAANAAMAMVQLGGIALVLGLTRTWARRVPPWLLLFPVWIGTGLLFQVVVAALVGASSAASSGSTDTGEFQPWVFAVVYPSFAGQGAALAIAFASYVRLRWGQLLREPVAAVVARRTGRDPSRPAPDPARAGRMVAVLAAAVAVAYGSAAVGGSLDGSRVLPNPLGAMQAARMVGAAATAIGLLVLAGPWGRRARFWVPAALTWLGSGAMVAFDGLALLALLLLGAAGSAPGWGLADTILVVKVVTGVLAGAVGALLVVGASRGRPVRDERSGLERRDRPRPRSSGARSWRSASRWVGVRPISTNPSRR